MHLIRVVGMSEESAKQTLERSGVVSLTTPYPDVLWCGKVISGDELIRIFIVEDHPDCVSISTEFWTRSYPQTMVRRDVRIEVKPEALKLENPIPRLG